MNKGILDGRLIFSEKNYANWTTPTIKSWGETEVCLSWFTQEMKGKRAYYHSGGDDSYRSFFGFFPEEQTAIF